MALDSATGSVRSEQGETTMRANIIHKLEFDGDAAYLTAGSLAFQQFVRDVTGEQVTITGATGFLLNAATTAITHVLHYDAAADTLQAFVWATGVEAANAADLSGSVAHMEVFSA